MSLKAKIAQNASIQIISKVLSTVLGVFSVVLMTRYLGKYSYGEYTTIVNFLSFFAIIADLGLTLVTVQMISHPDNEHLENKILNNLFTLRLVSIVSLIVLGPIIAFFLPYSGAIKLGILIASLSFIFPALSQVLVALFQKKLTMHYVAWAEILSRVAMLLGVVAGVYFNLGLNFILFTLVISSALSFFLQLYFSRKFTRINLAWDFSLWKSIFQKSWPLAVTIVFNLIYLKTDTLILSLVKNQGDVGIYGAAYRVIDILITVPYMFCGIVLPILTAAWATKNFDYFKAVFQKSYDFMLILAIPFIIGAQFLSTEIMTLVGGDSFAESGLALRILIGAAGLIFISAIFAHALIAVDKAKKTIPAYVFTAITSLVGYLIFIPKYSYIGAAWVTIYSEASITIFLAFLAYRYTNFFPKNKIFLKSIWASCFMAEVLILLPHNFYRNAGGLFIALILATAMYGAVLYLLRAIDLDDIKMFLLMKKK
ncbi:MAG: flippase [Candidatus Falkowbacteria bacterium]